MNSEIGLTAEEVTTAAAAVAKAYLSNVYDKCGNSQVYHAMRVAKAVADSLSDSDISIIVYAVGALHDVLEDSDCPEELILKLFGSEIYEAVVAITRQPGEKYKDYLRRCCRNPIARYVKWYDVDDNLRADRYFEGVPVKRYFDTLRYIYEYEAGLV